jgi:hypothetical protein
MHSAQSECAGAYFTQRSSLLAGCHRRELQSIAMQTFTFRIGCDASL